MHWIIFNVEAHEFVLFYVIIAELSTENMPISMPQS